MKETAFCKDSIHAIQAQLPASTEMLQLCGLTHPIAEMLPLDQAAYRFGLDGAALQRRLQRLQRLSGTGTAATESSTVLLERLEHEYRDALPDRLQLLALRAQRITAVHRNHPATPHYLPDSLRGLAETIATHGIHEREIVADGGGVDTPQLAAKHDAMRQELRKLSALTDEFMPPPDACRLWRKLYSELQDTVLDLAENIGLEDTILVRQPPAAGATDRGHPSCD